MNAVIAVATNFNPISIDRFITSFRQYNLLDKAVVIINKTDVEKHKEFCRNHKHDIEWFVIDDSYLFNKYYIISERFKMFTAILKQSNYEYVFLADVRDLIFQGDIFAKLNKLTFFKEAAAIEDDQYNKYTINHINPAAYQIIKSQPIINAGTIYGPKNKIIEVCEFLTDAISKTPIVLNEVNNPFNFDQPHLNVAVHYFKFLGGDFNLSGNEDGVVNTIGLSCAYKAINENGMFVTKHGIQSCVVHQFDRCDNDTIEKLKYRGLPVEDLLKSNN